MTEQANGTTTHDIDADALRAKYRAERDKRLRADMNAQFVDMEKSFGHFLHDPHADPEYTRDPIMAEAEVVVVGGGFSGLLTAARLKQAGIKGVRIIERGSDFGGTWYWNRYPGISCDVESYIYLPLVEELGVMPSRKYAPGEEIYGHCRAIAQKFDLYEGALLQTLVTEARWDEAAKRWTVRTSRGDELKARFFVVGNLAAFDRPKLPGLPGLDSFAGHSFHTARWDYDYTGGDANGGLTNLSDKVVGIIGTGATAVQCVPHLAEGAKHLYVFQRTPSSVDARNDRPTDPAWFNALEPGWQSKRAENFTLLTSGGTAEEDLVNDGWTELSRTVNTMFTKPEVADDGAEAEPIDAAQLVQLADFRKMERIRARVDDVVKDPAVAEALKPWYNQFCKRPCFHDDYLEAFNRPNVTLVDTAGKGVDRMTPGGVVVDGQEYPIDCMVFATGFEVGRDFGRRLGYPIYGRGGELLSDRWDKGVVSLHGHSVPGFPNCFIIGVAQSAFAFNFAHWLDEMAKHFAHIIARVTAEGALTTEATPEAAEAWGQEIERVAVARAGFLQECTPGYYNYEGDLSVLKSRNAPYGGGPAAYFRVLEAWRAEPDMPGLERKAG